MSMPTCMCPTCIHLAGRCPPTKAGPPGAGPISRIKSPPLSFRVSPGWSLLKPLEWACVFNPEAQVARKEPLMWSYLMLQCCAEDGWGLGVGFNHFDGASNMRLNDREMANQDEWVIHEQRTVLFWH